MSSKENFSSSHSQASGPAADIALVNGRIYTVDTARPWAEAVAIKGGRFLAVGSRQDINRFIGAGTEVVDLDGRFAMPGLYDMHCHPDLALAPRHSGYLDIGIENPTPDDVKKAILAYAAAHPGDGWVYGSYFVKYPFKQAGLNPGREWLDSVLPDRPVAILDRMWGSMMANSKAMELAGIDADTRDPRNGYLERDSITGEPTGIFIDGAYAMIHAAMPPTPQHALRRAYRDGIHYQSTCGVVGTKYLHVCEHRLQALKGLDDDGLMTLRVEAAISWQDDIFPVKRRWQLLAGERHYYRSSRLAVNAVKFHFDGTVEPRSSYLLTPWPGEDSWRGQLNLTPEHLADMLADLDRKGIRVVAHCTGDGASDVFLDAVAETRRRNGMPGVRHQCAHSTILLNENLVRFKELNVVAEFSGTSWYPSKYVSGARSGYGQERLARAYNIKGVIDAGGIAVMGTDWPVYSPDPWVGFETMITRENPWDEVPGKFGEPISLEQAMRVMTINGAMAMECEHSAGSIEAGKSADLIVLDRNLFEISPKLIHDTQVELTFFEGKLAYDRHGRFDGSPSQATWRGAQPEL